MVSGAVSVMARQNTTPDRSRSVSNAQKQMLSTLQP
jgi:predicted outer membrane protein